MSEMDANKGLSKKAFNEMGQAVLASSRDYSPDSIIIPMIIEARKIDPASSDFRLSLSKALEQRFTLEESKALIITALDEFDKSLGDKAQEIFQTAHYNNGIADVRAEAKFRKFSYDASNTNTENPILSKNYNLDVNEESRWNLIPVPPGQCRLMRCLPAESDQKEWTNIAYDPANPHPYAVIEYQFDGTIDAVVYMAHELGHAIADDYGRETGKTYRDNPTHIVEMQAYLTQHIIYDYLKHHQDANIADSACRHFDVTMTQNLNDLRNNPSMEGRPMSILIIRGLHDHLR
ncbi:MAG: hypothetical protein AAB276_03100, partial [Pseudomonadota bacterium]